jgi:EAL domain-containing protein (putative c-di-GMP-specific phosphodiesterase class I)
MPRERGATSRRHPTRDVLAPSLFIPIAEDTGSVADLTYALLGRAVNDARSWPDDIFISINLSPRQFADSQLPQRILGILEIRRVAPRSRITETTVVRSLDDAKRILQKLRDVGVEIALDDFGTGYAGLYHLRDLQLNSIKIDWSFISKMLDKSEEGKIVEAMISLAHTLGLHVTAESVETEQVLAKLFELGCRNRPRLLLRRSRRQGRAPYQRCAAKPSREVA